MIPSDGLPGQGQITPGITPQHEGRRTERNIRLIPYVVASTFFMQMLDTSILNTSLPQMAGTFGVRPLDMSVGVTIYMLVFAALLPLSGWCSERFGARTVFQFAVAVFTVSSLACGLSGDLATFIASRALQGVGAAMMTPVGRVLVLKATPKSELLPAFATITWPALAAPLVGPLLGGFLTTTVGWRWNFLINLPVGLASLALIARFVPRHQPRPGLPFDIKGFLLASTSLAGALHGVESLAHGDARRWLPWACLAWGVGGGTWAVRHLSKVTDPLLDLSPMRIPTFRLAALSAGMWIRVAISTTPFLLPLFLQLSLGFSAVAAGAYLSTYFAGNLVMKSFTTRALRRFGFRPVVVWNCLFVGVSLICLLALGQGLPKFVVAAALFAAGMVRSLQFTCLASLVFADVPDRLGSSASTLSSMAQQISMALGVSAAAAFLTASRSLAGREDLQRIDFQLAIVGSALLAFLAGWLFRALPRGAGAEITGHVRSQEAPMRSELASTPRIRAADLR